MQSSARESRNVEHRITDWLRLRQQILVKICSIHELPLKEQTLPPGRRKIDQLCELLIDYISAGHFEIYHHLLDAFGEQSPELFNQFNSILKEIETSTDEAIAFNDRYEFCTDSLIDEQFGDRLSALTESLIERFEMEDTIFSQANGDRSLSA